MYLLLSYVSLSEDCLPIHKTFEKGENGHVIEEKVCELEFFKKNAISLGKVRFKI